MSEPLPLEGVFVIGLENAAAGPLCTRNLSDLGARVIKIEKPGEGDMTRHADVAVGPYSSVDLWVHPGKESLTLDVKHPRAREIVLRLVERADIVVENLRPGLAAEIGLSYEVFSERNPGIIHCQVTGYGQTGPYAEKKAFDLIMQGEAGLIEQTGLPEAPARIGLNLCDAAAGLYATIAILAALNKARETGHGGHIDVSMLESSVWLLSQLPYRYWTRGEVPGRHGVRHALVCPSGVYEASDGRFNISVVSQPQWSSLCRVIERPGLLSDPRFSSGEQRSAHKAELNAILEPIFRQRSAADWLKAFDAAGLPAGDVRTLPSVLAHPQLEARGFIQEVPGDYGPMKLFNFPAKFDGHYYGAKSLPPLLGQNTEEILTELGYSPDDVAALKNEGVV